MSTSDDDTHQLHGHGHGHAHGHGHGHGGEARGDGPVRRVWAGVRHVLTPHSHDAADSIDAAVESSAEGIRAVKISLVVLGATAIAQLMIVLVSGSVALLADTIHNFSDALTAVPLWIAFALGRRAATSRYTYGFGRAEDLAGLFVVAMITLSSVVAGYESIRRLITPEPLATVWVVLVAGLLGFAGNELVAVYRIRVGRRIGSAALVADGLHARTDGFTSLAVVLGAVGVLLGFPLADPIVGLIITVAILVVLKGAATDIYRRLMDAVDPATVERARTLLAQVDGVSEVDQVRMRWIGHTLHAEADLTVDDALTLTAAHDIAHRGEHRLQAQVARLGSATVHVHPRRAHHEPAGTGLA